MAKKKKNKMYKDAKTWNPFRGCTFDCSYCDFTFKLQAKRRKPNPETGKGCQECYDYTPHVHEDRIHGLPSTPIIFVCGNGDFSQCPADFAKKIVERVQLHAKQNTGKTYFFQSKAPKVFEKYLGMFGPEVILLTTLETNRDAGYDKVSKAPKPSKRYADFAALNWPRKIVTIEPVMDFDLDEFHEMIVELGPEAVYLGFNSKPKNVQLPEPSEEKMVDFMEMLTNSGIEIRPKDLRGVTLP